MRGVSPHVPVLMATRSFHHLIHKIDQGVHKGTNMNEIYSRLISFVPAPKTKPGTGGNAGLLKSLAMLKLGCFALSGRCCYRRSHDSPKKVIISTALLLFSLFSFIPVVRTS